jgi:hypothetical protein
MHTTGAFGSGLPLDNWFKETEMLKKVTDEFVSEKFQRGLEDETRDWLTKVSAESSILLDEYAGLRPLISEQSEDSLEKAEQREEEYLEVLNFRIQSIAEAYRNSIKTK